MNLPVTSDMVARRIADLKTKVMHIVRNFEKSGNGDGNLIESERGNWEHRDVNHNEFGKFNRLLYKSDHRREFLGAYEQVCLYVWHMIDKYDLIESTICTLGQNQGGGNNDVQETDKPFYKREKKKSKQQDGTEVFLVGIKQTIGYAELSKAQDIKIERLHKYEDQLDELDDNTDISDALKRKKKARLIERIESTKRKIEELDVEMEAAKNSR